MAQGSLGFKHKRENDIKMLQSYARAIYTMKILKTFLILCGIADMKTVYETNRVHLAGVCTLIKHRRRQNVVRTSVTLLACSS